MKTTFENSIKNNLNNQKQCKIIITLKDNFINIGVFNFDSLQGSVVILGCLIYKLGFECLNQYIFELNFPYYTDFITRIFRVCERTHCNNLTQLSNVCLILHIHLMANLLSFWNLTIIPKHNIRNGIKSMQILPVRLMRNGYGHKVFVRSHCNEKQREIRKSSEQLKLHFPVYLFTFGEKLKIALITIRQEYR